MSTASFGDPGLISVITASHQPHALWLERAYESLCEQELQGYEWEWCLQLDGDESLLESVPEAVLADPRVHAQANGSVLGAAATRNYALVRSRGAFVRNLDGDDWLLPEALQRSAEALEADPELCFVFTGALLGEEDGSLRPHPVVNPHPPGRVEPAAMGAFWNAGNHFGFICTTVMFRRLHLLAYGGWAALRRSEDAGVMIPMAAVHPVYHIPAPSVVYRLHPQQITRADEENIRAANILFMEQRINAASILAGEETPPPAPSPYPSFHTLYE